MPAVFKDIVKLSGPFLIILTLFTWLSASQLDEYLVKAAFIQKFTQFVEWESVPNRGESSVLVVGIVGKDPFNGKLKQFQIESGQRTYTASVKVLNDLSELRDCEVVFIARSEKSRIQSILDYTSNRPILTIGDTRGYALKGVLINMYISDNNIRFEINESAARDSGLQLSYLLLNMARLVNPIGIAQ